MPQQQRDTSWHKVSPWYNQLVGDQGHYYHQHVVLPNVLRLLQLQPTSSLADLGCGQGILAGSIPPIAQYLGIDNARGLIAAAQKRSLPPGYQFQVHDLTKPLPTPSVHFSHAIFVLSLQNMRHPEVALRNATALLQPGGKLVLVLNHPCFRIPRQSGWDIDAKTKQQFRWVNRYLSPLEIPITMHPGQHQPQVTWSFHHSLHDYFASFKKCGLLVSDLEEWQSDKESVGKASKMENRARQEIPLFLAIVAIKK